ncbi:XkdW family protein [Paenibacillus gansuensis]|uniref:XkdW family protein n=1 Tax=Paenibacillus gansuensis TaxID=306542 RepID=A0ABW5PGF3_9BACL
MNIAKAIMTIYPDADPFVDFRVQDDGDEKGPYIAAWNLSVPQPNKSELNKAWEAYLTAESAKPPMPPPVTEQVRIIDERTTGMQEIDQFTLEQLNSNEERTAGMQEIDEYTLELVFQMRTEIDELRAEIAALKGGA